MAKFCETYDGQNVSTTLRYAGSTRYMAIELLWEGATKTTNGSDMWAFGMTCVEVRYYLANLLDGNFNVHLRS